MYIPSLVRDFLKQALAEDIGNGDLTTLLTIDETKESEASVIAKSEMVLAGTPFFREVFSILDESVNVEILKDEGETLKRGEEIAKVSGKTASILSGERVSLNILGMLSGIATLTDKFVASVKGFPVKIVDTRKTTPNMRYMEKYAVRTGGGGNHRFGLYDGILIKDNHIKAAGSIKKALDKARKVHHLLKIEVEAASIAEVSEAVEAGADVIMLDNMSMDEMRESVKFIKSENIDILIEASGNVSPENVRDIAETGVDIISTGFITHSSLSADISMKI